MNEAALRNYVRKGLHAKGMLTTHHEDALNSGIPDLSYSGGAVNGWIELKWLEAWPKRADTIVRIPHYTKEQKHFLLSRGRAGGRCWLLLRVAKEIFIFHHDLAQGLGEMTQQGTRASCSGSWGKKGRLDFEQLTRLLTR